MDTSYFSATAKEALTAFNQTNFQYAAELFGKAAEEYTSENKPLLAAEMKNNQSVAYIQADDPQSALNCLKGVADQFENAQDQYKAGLTYGNLATAHQALNNLDQAKDYCFKAADYLREGNHSEEYTMIMNMLVSIQMKQGKLFDAAASAHLFIDQIPHPTFRQRLLKIVYKIYKFFTKLF